MSAVLIASRKKGRSGWIAARGAACLRLTGLQPGDIVTITLKGGKMDGGALMFREKDGTAKLPPCLEFVRAEHTETSGHPIYIDLLR